MPKIKKLKTIKSLRGLPELPDYIKADLNILFIGINPGRLSATLGHHYANPQNLFWSSLNQSGLIPENKGPLSCYDDCKCPDLFNIGFTNLVARATCSAVELKLADYKTGTDILLQKLVTFKPKCAVFIGKGIFDQFIKYLASSSLAKIKDYKFETFGWQPLLFTESTGTTLTEKFSFNGAPKPFCLNIDTDKSKPPASNQTRLFVLPSTSPANAKFRNVVPSLFKDLTQFFQISPNCATTTPP